MATVRWRGDAVAIQEVQTITVGGTWDDEDTLTITINGKDLTLTFSGGAPSTSEVAAAIKAAWNGEAVTAEAETRTSPTGDQIPEYAEITASVSSAVVTLTHNTAGVPFTVAAVDGSTSGTLTVASVTAATGPSWWTNADNWTGGAVPADGDTVILEDSDVDILYGLDNPNVEPTLMEIRASYTGRVGLPEWNENGYYEYRVTYLRLGPATLTVGNGPGQGSSRLKINCGDDQVLLNVFNTAAPETDGVESLLWKGTHASNAVNITRGSVGIAVLAGEVATVATLRVGYVTSVEGDATVRCGSGLTHTTVEQSGGTLTLAANCTTITKTDGTLYCEGSMTVTTLNNRKGTLFYKSSGTMTTLNVGSDAIADFRQDMRARTVTNTNLYKGSALFDPHKTVARPWTITPVECELNELTLDLGTNLSVAVT